MANIPERTTPEGRRWHSAPGRPEPHWLWIQFRERARIEKIVMHQADPKAYPVSFVGEYSPDGGLTFIKLFSVTNNHMDARTFAVEKRFKPMVTDNFRVRILESLNHQSSEISELEVFGQFIRQTAVKGRARVSESRLLDASSSDGLRVTQKSDGLEFRSPWLRLECSTQRPTIKAFCWDSLGEGKLEHNLLKDTPDGGIHLSQKALFGDSVNGNDFKCGAGRERSEVHPNPGRAGHALGNSSGIQIGAHGNRSQACAQLGVPGTSGASVSF